MFEPSGDSRVLAMTLWDNYQAFIGAGFSELQAFKLIETMMWSTCLGNSSSG